MYSGIERWTLQTLLVFTSFLRTLPHMTSDSDRKSISLLPPVFAHWIGLTDSVMQYGTFIHRFESLTSQNLDYHNPNLISNKIVEKRPCTYSTYRAVWRLLCALSNDPVFPVVIDHDCVVRWGCRNLDQPHDSLRLSSDTPSNDNMLHNI